MGDVLLLCWGIKAGVVEMKMSTFKLTRDFHAWKIADRFEMNLSPLYDRYGPMQSRKV